MCADFLAGIRVFTAVSGSDVSDNVTATAMSRSLRSGSSGTTGHSLDRIDVHCFYRHMEVIMCCYSYE